MGCHPPKKSNEFSSFFVPIPLQELFLDPVSPNLDLFTTFPDFCLFCSLMGLQILESCQQILSWN